MNAKTFWGTIRENLFIGKLSQGAFDTIDCIVDAFLAERYRNTKHLAYDLATAYHEAYNRGKNPEWLPVREGFSSTNEGAVRAVTRLYDQGRIKTNYALPQDNGHSYYGRGFVQITWPENYRKMGKRLGIDLFDNPDLALDRKVAARLLVIGSEEGLYTGRALSNYDLPDGGFDAFNARRVINGLDKAELIKGYYEIFNIAISSATA